MKKVGMALPAKNEAPTIHQSQPGNRCRALTLPRPHTEVEGYVRDINKQVKGGD
jgi:hypothetical protein